ncbi:hypothetical protein GP486_001062 [Trichoglossum hirsutum]|uniref:CHAT domain-containing protein n=1 Tax=Trichoglossum hirsutum TaxID=265104 RepID=A0A9P8LHW4_9PEZI|nr:hypothetical protein GP486_001062 [Trichoglossum hirsutum]
MAALNLDSFASRQRYPLIVYSLHPSLYAGLDAGLVQTLDDAAMLGRGFFAYPQAMTLINRLPAQERLMPAVAIQEGQLLLSQRRYGEAASVLLGALESATRDEELAMDKWEVRLLKVMHSYAVCYSKGDFRSGVQAMHDIRVWLERVALEDYTDLQVDCVQYYYSIALLCILEMPNFDVSQYGDFPRFVKSDGLWVGMTRVREYLQGRGRLAEALYLLTMELIFTIADRKEAVIRSFLDDCTKRPMPTQPMWLLNRTAKLLLSDFLRGNGSYSAARSELSEARLISENALPLSWGDIGHHSALLFSFKDAEMDMAGDYDLTTMFGRWIEIADEAESLENFHRVDLALCKAIDIADARGRQTRCPPWTERLFSTHARLEALYREQGSVFWLLHKYSVTVPNFAASTLTGCGDALEWISTAKEEYLDFDFVFTGLRVRLEVGKRELASRTGARHLILEANAAESEASNCEQIFWESHAPPAIQIAPIVSERNGGGSTDNTRSVYHIGDSTTAGDFTNRIPFSHVNEELRESMETFGLHHYAGTDAEPDQTNWRVLLRWMREDYSRKALTGEELHRIFPLVVPSGTSTDSWDTFLTQLNEHDLRDKTMNCDIRQWGDIRDTIVLWLGRSKHRPEMMREFFACFLQWARLLCGEAVASKDTDVAIIEAQKLVALLASTKSPSVQDIFSQESISAQRLIYAARAHQIRQFKGNEDMSRELIEECVFGYSNIIDEDRACGWQEGEAVDLIESVRFRLFANSKGFAFSIEDMIKDLNRAADIFTDWRRGFAASGVIKSVRNQEAQTLFYWPWDPHQLAVAALGANPEIENHGTMMWDFIQRAKARALGDFIGMEMVLSDSMIEKGSLSPESVQLLLDEKAILASLKNTNSSTQRAQLRETHKDILSRMKSQLDLTTIVSVRDCLPFTLEDMQAITRIVGEDVVFVDWFIIDSSFHKTNSLSKPLFTPEEDPIEDSSKDSSCVILVTARAGQPPKVWGTKLGVSQIEEWLSDGKLEDDDMGVLSNPNANTWLEAINALVKPLGSASQPGDLLVFCPTKFLHGIPLHALKVDGEVLIRRNPIIYTYSLSQLRHCFFNYQQGHAGDPPDWKATVFCPLQSEEGSISASEFGKLVDAELLLDSAATKARLITEIADTTFLHFHGHCRSNGSDIVDKYLEVSPENETPPPESGKLTVRDLFRIPRANTGYHVNLLACASGEAQASPADNSLGMTTAFLHCGATSTVSALWPLGDAIAVILEKAFGRAVSRARQFGEAEQRVVNIAKVVQEVACEIMDIPKTMGEADIAPPHYWAPFVAHGFWLMRV